MTQEVLKQMYQLLLTEPHAPTVCAQLERIAREALAEHAMREVQRLGQEIEQCQCTECQIKPHASDCAVHSEPAYPKGKCDCGAQPEQEPKIGCVNHDCDQCKAQPDQEPVIGKWSLREVYFDEDGEPISHRSPPQRTEQPAQRTWVGLTEQDLDYLCNLAYTGDEEFALAVQAKLMEKNA